MVRVRVADVSGLPANAGCFLALDPRCWAVPPEGHAADVTAFPGITFALSLESREDPAPDASDDTRDRIEEHMFHTIYGSPLVQAWFGIFQTDGPPRAF